MKTKLIHSKGQVSLVIDNKLKSRKESDVLATLSNYADTCCWCMEDIRLTQNCVIGQYLLVSDGAYRSSHLPKDKSEADYVKSKLREFREDPDGTLIWSSF